MKLLLWTRDDPASLRIASALVSMGRFGDTSRGPDMRVDPASEAALARVEGSLLHADFADRKRGPLEGAGFDRALFLSKHSAASGVRALTVHPIGNLGGEAKLGGEPRSLAPPDPSSMTNLLRALADEAKGLSMAASFEATHHGPRMDIPSLFVEVGSTPSDWESAALCEAVARAVVKGYLDSAPRPAAPAALGIGGGHYHPKQTDAARREGTAVGHLLPSYCLADLEPATLEAAADLTGATLALVDGIHATTAALQRACAALEARGVRPVLLGE